METPRQTANSQLHMYFFMYVQICMYIGTCFPSCLQVGHPNFPLNWVILHNDAFAGRSASTNNSRALQTTSPSPLTVTLTPTKNDDATTLHTSWLQSVNLHTICSKILYFLQYRCQAHWCGGFIWWAPNTRQKHMFPWATTKYWSLCACSKYSSSQKS